MMMTIIDERMDGRMARAAFGCLLLLTLAAARPAPAQVDAAEEIGPVRQTIFGQGRDARLDGDSEWAAECPQRVCMRSNRNCIQDPDCCGGLDCIKVPTSLPVFYRFDPNGIWTIQAPTAGACGLERPEFWKICGPPLLNATCES
jgi:hypothetical protein